MISYEKQHYNLDDTNNYSLGFLKTPTTVQMQLRRCEFQKFDCYMFQYQSCLETLNMIPRSCSNIS